VNFLAADKGKEALADVAVSSTLQIKADHYLFNEALAW
jgi:hypothetical protein